MTDYVLEGPKWPSPTITWSFAQTNVAGQRDPFSSYFTPGPFEDAIQAAFAEWSSETALHFVQVTDSAHADIRLGLDTFDGPSGIAGQTSYAYTVTASNAETFLPDVVVRLDSGERYSLANGQEQLPDGITFEAIALHEIGHALGLGHYTAGPAIMNPEASPTITALTQSDIDGIQALYGSPSTGPSMAEGRIIDGVPGHADHLVGTDAAGTVSYAGATSAVVVDLASQLTWDGSVNDTLSGIESAIGSKFGDVLEGDEGNNVLDGGIGGADRIDGHGGSDTVSYADSASSVVIDLGVQVTWDGTNNDVLSSIENAIGSKYDDVLDGDDGNNVLDGGAGGIDHINGHGGSDTVSYASSASGVVIDLGAQLTWDGSVNDVLSSIENAIGSKYDDIIEGNEGDNVLDGGAGGADRIDGHGGVDAVSYASSLSGVVIDLSAHLTWDGTNNDTLSSIENAIGSTHDDILIAARTGSPNVLTGGLGSDTFSFRSGFGHDVVTDFVAAGDVHDIIEIGHGLFAHDDPLAAAHDTDAGVVLTANAQEDITLLGLHRADLATTDFHFA